MPEFLEQTGWGRIGFNSGIRLYRHMTRLPDMGDKATAFHGHFSNPGANRVQNRVILGPVNLHKLTQVVIIKGFKISVLG